MMEIQQFDAAYDKNSWFVALKNALIGLTAEEASWKPDGADNSIRQTVNHIYFYNHAYCERFKGVEYQYETDDNDETFAEGDVSEDAWWREVARLDSTMNEFRDLIRAADESKLFESVPQKRERRWVDVISDINAHNAYHGGQILLIRKLQGSWDRTQGVS
jgi:uncharacterized damage-inducible protein DinB